MKTLISSICLLSLFPATLFSQEEAVPESDSKINGTESIAEHVQSAAKTSIVSEKNRLFRKDVILRINEILEKVQLYYPVLADKLTDQNKEEILKSLASTLNCGIEYRLEGEVANAERSPPNAGKAALFPAIIIAAHKVLYIRVDSFSPEAVKQLQTDCESSFRLANLPAGIILDLRNARGNNCTEALKSLGLFISPDKIPVYDGIKPLKQVLKTPVMILIGAKTKGAPELFATLMIQAGSGMLLGEKSAGIPFAKKQVTLSNGDLLLVPVVPENLKEIKPVSVQPAIIFPAYPQVEFKKLRNEAGIESNDQCLQRSIDLIICLKALSADKKTD